MIALDIRTIIFSYVLTDIVCVLVMILLWRQNRRRLDGAHFWVLNYAFQLLALVLIVSRGATPDWASIVLSNGLVVAGAFFGYLALLRFTGAARFQGFNYVYMGLMLLAHIYLTFIHPDLHLRTINVALGLLIMTFQCAWFAFLGAPPADRPLMRGVGGIFTMYCVVSLIRILHSFIITQTRQDFFSPDTFDSLSMLAYQILFIALTFVVGLMYNKRLVADLQTQEEKFSKAFHSSPYAITISRLSDGALVEVNDGFVEISGYNYSDIRGKTSLELNLWHREEDRLAAVQELAQMGKVTAREFAFRKKTGEKITCLFSAEQITIGQEPCILSSINDITDRKKMEEALHETRDYLENLFNYANAPIIVWDSRFCITKFNRAFERLSGRKEQDVLGCGVDILFPPATRERSLEYIKRTGAGDRWETVEIDIRHVDDSVSTLLWNSASLYLPDGKTVLATIAQGHDITLRKAAQEEIKRLNEALEQKVAAQNAELRESQLALLNLVDDLNASTNEITSANRSLEAVNRELAAFSYSVSHDLRAPLRSIDGFGNALLEDYADKLDEEGKHYLQRIRKATQTMAQLIDDLLNLSRVTQSEFYRQDFDLSALVREIAEANQLKNPQSNLKIDIQDGITARADQRLVNIAVINLMDNAVKFCGKCEQPHIEFGAKTENGETVYFIRDNGAGFEMAYADKIFGAFQRLHRSDEFPGTGIGLATVQRIINRHGGRIRAEGKVGKGATFFFTLGE